jgi:hypothetical protein
MVRRTLYNDVEPFPLSLEQITEAYNHHYENGSRESREKQAKETLQIYDDQINIYHAGALDYWLQTLGNSIIKRDTILETRLENIEKRVDNIGELAKKVNVLTPFTDANQVLINLLKPDFQQDITYDLELPPEYDKEMGRKADADVQLAENKLRTMFWDLDDILHEKSQIILFDLLSEQTTGSYIEMVEALLRGKHSYFILKNKSYITEDPFVSYALNKFEKNIIISPAFTPDGLSIETTPAYTDILEKILKGIDEDEKYFQNTPEQENADKLIKLLENKDNKNYNEFVQKMGETTYIMQENRFGQSIPWAIAYTHLIKDREKVVAIVKNPIGANTYLRSQGIGMITYKQAKEKGLFQHHDQK